MDIIIAWAIITGIIMLICACGVLENSSSYQRDERKVAARTFVLAPVWPILLMVWIAYCFYYVINAAFNDGQSAQPMNLTRRLWMEH